MIKYFKSVTLFTTCLIPLVFCWCYFWCSPGYYHSVLFFPERLTTTNAVISRLSSQLQSEVFVWSFVVGANLAVVLLTALANRCWSSGLMFGYWLMLRLKLTTLFSKAYSIHLHYAIHFTNNVRQSQAFNWATKIGIRLVETDKSFNWSKLTKHRKTVGNEAAVRKVCAKREVVRKRSAVMSEDTHKKKLVRLSTDLQSWMVRYFRGLIICI